MASYVDKDELVTQIKVQAMTIMMFTASEPEAELPEPTGMRDLDSFSVVQLILSLEEIYDVQLLEEMPSFTGETFEELADMVAGFVRAKENAGENLAQADT
jgi:acyl carrier protein